MDKPTEDIPPFDVGHTGGLFDRDNAVGNPKGWQIEPVIVVEVDLLAIHLHAIEMPVTDLAGLEIVLLPPRAARRVRQG